MRGAALVLGIILLLPGACSLIFMLDFGPLFSLKLILAPFRSGYVGPYEELTLEIWGVSFLVGLCGIFVIRSALERSRGAPPKPTDEQEPK